MNTRVSVAKAGTASPLANGIPFVQRKCACGSAAGLSGECEECGKKKMAGIQTKLAISQPGDPYEQEADRVATQVMAARSHSAVTGTPFRIQQFSGQPVGRTGVPLTSVDEVVASPGRPLEPTLRQDMEQRFGHDFSRVRVHTGATAERSARGVGAKAYTVGHRVVFGAGRYAPGTQAGRCLIAHELTHVVQQRAGSSPVVQRDVVDEVREKLSYGLFDWAITDTEAIDSLALLSTIPPADLPAALSRLGTKFVSRLLDNLPDAAKSGEIYQRLMTALGSAGTMDYAAGQLSYGLFDWAVTGAEVARVFNLFTNLPAAERENFLVGLDKAGKLGRLLGNASIGHYTMHLVPWMKGLTKGRLSPEQRSIMRTIVKKAPTSPIDILKLATELRYDVTIGPTTIPGRTPVPWDGKKLRDTYLALDHLPEAHVARNKELVRFGQFSQPERKLADDTTVITAGVYNKGKQELASNVKKQGDIAPTMIHETGHAVDAEMGWSTGPEPAKPERGGWKEYPDHRTCATDMVDDSNGGIKTKLVAAQRTDVIDDMATAMGNRSAAALATDIRARPWFKGLPAGTRSDVLDDQALKAIPIGLQTPWFTAEGGGEHLGDHVYQESYTPTWVRYRHEARSRMVAKYQFRDAGEWFAECYAAYYDPDNKVKGQKLNKVDANTKTYFDSHVDTRAPTR